MDKIKKPSTWRLAISLVPLPFLLAYVIITGKIPNWVIYMTIMSAVIFSGKYLFFHLKNRKVALWCYTIMKILLWVITAIFILYIA